MTDEQAEALHRPPEETNKDRGKQAFQRYVDNALPKSVFVYSDGSQYMGRTAWAWVAYQDGIEVDRRHGVIRDAEVFDAEARGVAEATTWAAARQHHLLAPEYYFCVDNTAVVYGSTGRVPISSQTEFLRIRKQLTKLTPAKTRIVWSPGHVGIDGNEAADEHAKAAAHPDNHDVQVDGDIPTASHAKRIVRLYRQREYDQWWKTSQPVSYRSWKLPMKTRPPELAMRRPILHRLLAERSGHGDFADYHDRFGHTAPRKLCRCGKVRMQGHFIQCPIAKPFLPDWLTEGKELKGMLSNEGWLAFQDMVQDSRVYDEPDEAESDSEEEDVLGWLQSQTPTHHG